MIDLKIKKYLKKVSVKNLTDEYNFIFFNFNVSLTETNKKKETTRKRTHDKAIYVDTPLDSI